MRPHRRQPTRLPRPWDSPGKNTGVGCHFLLQCVKVKSLSRVRLFRTPWTAAHQAPPSTGFSRQECWSGVPSPSPDSEVQLQAVHAPEHYTCVSLTSVFALFGELVRFAYSEMQRPQVYHWSNKCLHLSVQPPPPSPSRSLPHKKLSPAAAQAISTSTLQRRPLSDCLQMWSSPSMLSLGSPNGACSSGKWSPPLTIYLSSAPAAVLEFGCFSLSWYCLFFRNES